MILFRSRIRHEGGEDDVEYVEKTELDVYVDGPREKVDDTFDIMK